MSRNKNNRKNLTRLDLGDKINPNGPPIELGRPKNTHFEVAMAKSIVDTPYTDDLNPSNSWVKFGLDNLFPSWLLNISQATTHQAMISLRTAYIYGRGLVYDETSCEATQFEQFRNSCTDTGAMDLDELLRRLCRDYAIWNTYSFKVVYGDVFTKDTSEPYLDEENGEPVINPVSGLPVYRQEIDVDATKIKKLRYVDPSRIRLTRLKISDQLYTHAFLSFDWRHWTQGGRFTPAEIPLFDGARFQSAEDLYYHYGSNLLGSNPYPLPVYMDAISSIQAEVEINAFTLNSLKGQFGIQASLTIPQQLARDEQAEFIGNFDHQYKGNYTDQKMMYLFATGLKADGTPVVPKLEYHQPTFPAQAYLETQMQVSQNIMRAHGVPFSVASLTSSATLGSDGNQLAVATTAWDISENNAARLAVIKGLHKVLLFNGFSKEFVRTVQLKGLDLALLFGTPAPPMF